MRRWLIGLVTLLAITAACGDSGSEERPSATGTGAQEPDITEPATADGNPTDLAITEVVFGDHVTITNLGSEAVSVAGLWLCNRPNYTELPTAVIAPGATIEVPADALGGLPQGGAEAALYTSNSFGDSAAIIDYVAWGSGGGRSEVATEAGLWPADDTISVSDDAIRAPAGGASSADWSS